MASFDASDHFLVAAIDFGTTYSGYAFSLTSSPDEIRANTNWTNNQGYASYKAPTSVLLTHDRQLEAFGFDAHERYSELLVDGEADGYYFFDRFKMMLDPTVERELATHTLLTATNGKTLPAVEVFAHTMRFLKQHMLREIGRTRKDEHRTFEILEDDIRWVVTVPAIWDEAAKQFMRLAAEEAGLAAKDDRQRLRIALEPESASLFCLDFPQNFLGELASNHPLTISGGTRYMVVDCGGGTVDITVHEVRPDKKIREIHCATGGPWGGTQVDANFYRLMDDIFGQDFMDQYRREYPAEWLKMREAFDFKKRLPAPQVNLPIFYHFNNSHKTMKKSEIKQSVDRSEWGKKGVTFSNGYLRLTDKVMEEMFHPVVSKIVEHLESLTAKESLTNIEYFFLVGGFSESPILQKAIKDRFSPQVRVLVPEEAGLAVMKGAVMFGHRPFSISERVSPKTFGIQCSSEYDASKHKGGRYSLEGLRLICPDVFFKFVEVGQRVSTKHGSRYLFRPSRRDQTKAEIRLYETIKKDANLVTEDKMVPSATTVLCMPDIDRGKDRAIEIVFYFGDTDVSVEAIDLTSNSKANVTVNFLDDNIRAFDFNT